MIICGGFKIGDWVERINRPTRRVKVGTFGQIIKFVIINPNDPQKRSAGTYAVLHGMPGIHHRLENLKLTANVAKSEEDKFSINLRSTIQEVVRDLKGGK